MAKSWDIQPSVPRPGATRPATPPAAPARPVPPPLREPVRHQQQAVPTRREAVRRASPAPVRTPLKLRRKSHRKRLITLAGIVLALLVVLGEVLLWQPFLRVQTVEADGVDADRLQTFVMQDLVGTRFLIVPKNSIFFIPEKDLRAHVLAAFPDTEAVSIHPNGLTTLSVRTVERATVFWWCGVSPATPEPSCYQADQQGYIFAEVPLDQRYATSSNLSLFVPLAKPLDVGASPIGNSIVSPALLPPLMQFVKAMRSLNANVVSVTMRGDEADLYTEAGTRITYVLGREQQAAALAASAFSTLNLNDGSLLYVDLRFDSKVFFKKK